MRFASLRALLGLVAAGELGWSLLFYFHPQVALSALGRVVLDPVIARQLPLYLASVAFAYALGATNPLRYRGVVWICAAQRLIELVVALIDWRAHAIATAPFLWLATLEIVVAGALLALLRGSPSDATSAVADTRDRGLMRLLRGFGALEIFWFLASTIFVQLGARLLHWKLQDPYTTQQQGIALLVIGLTSLLAAGDLSTYRIFVWVPIVSQFIGIANSLNEVRLGSITWSVAATQWAIEATLAGAFMFFLYQRERGSASIPALAE